MQHSTDFRPKITEIPEFRPFRSGPVKNQNHIQFRIHVKFAQSAVGSWCCRFGTSSSRQGRTSAPAPQGTSGGGCLPICSLWQGTSTTSRADLLPPTCIVPLRVGPAAVCLNRCSYSLPRSPCRSPHPRCPRPAAASIPWRAQPQGCISTCRPRSSSSLHLVRQAPPHLAGSPYLPSQS
jgi:hypothetical protein